MAGEANAPAGAAGVPATPAKAPASPAKAPAGAGGDVSRREAMSLGLGWAGLLASLGAGTAGMVRFLYPNVTFEPPQQFKVGFPSAFNKGVDEKYKTEFGVWICRNDDSIYALISVCTHLGCTPNWLEAEKKFKCPCHGSGFYSDGINFEGPAPRPLERAAIKIDDDGQLLVDKNQKFLYEMGQWENPASFVEFRA